MFFNTDKLVCPITKKKLLVIDYESFDIGEKKFLKKGVLYEPQSKYAYPVINGVPVMLTFITPLAQGFFREYGKDIETRLGGSFRSPDMEPMPGEKSIQITFTEEWGGLGDDEFTFAYSDDELYELHKNVWLRMPQEELDSKKQVLNVGCGFGKEAMVLSKIFSNTTVHAIDLNLSVIQAGMNILEKTSGAVLPVIASLYRMPFQKNYFDHVHCQGVTHHTYSTEQAFYAIESEVKEKGSIFMWVYAWEDSFGIPGLRGFLIHVYYFVSHRIFRPILSRSPEWFRKLCVHMIALPYHLLVSKRRAKHKDTWKYANTVHGIQDMFTPRYAHRHRFNEVLTWYERQGYHVSVQSPLTYEKLTGKRLLGIGYVGR